VDSAVDVFLRRVEFSDSSRLFTASEGDPIPPAPRAAPAPAHGPVASGSAAPVPAIEEVPTFTPGGYMIGEVPTLKPESYRNGGVLTPGYWQWEQLSPGGYWEGPGRGGQQQNQKH